MQGLQQQYYIVGNFCGVRSQFSQLQKLNLQNKAIHANSFNPWRSGTSLCNSMYCKKQTFCCWNSFSLWIMKKYTFLQVVQCYERDLTQYFLLTNMYNMKISQFMVYFIIMVKMNVAWNLFLHHLWLIVHLKLQQLYSQIFCNLVVKHAWPMTDTDSRTVWSAAT